jgi:hypothetical protein
MGPRGGLDMVHLPGIDGLCTDRIENITSNIYSVFSCVSVAKDMCLSLCLAMALLFIDPFRRNRHVLSSHATVKILNK